LHAIVDIGEVVRPEVLATRRIDILTADVQGARKEERSPKVQAAANQALYNSLVFIRDSSNREGERKSIMQGVCEATQSITWNVRSSA
jgi:hypothetical protein